MKPKCKITMDTRDGVAVHYSVWKKDKWWCWRYLSPYCKTLEEAEQSAREWLKSYKPPPERKFDVHVKTIKGNGKPMSNFAASQLRVLLTLGIAAGGLLLFCLFGSVVGLIVLGAIVPVGVWLILTAIFGGFDK